MTSEACWSKNYSFSERKFEVLRQHIFGSERFRLIYKMSPLVKSATETSYEGMAKGVIEEMFYAVNREITVGKIYMRRLGVAERQSAL